MTTAELLKLLHVARWRPLAEFGRESVKKDAEDVRSKRGTWTMKPLTIENIDDAVDRAREVLADNTDFITQLELRGRERQLVYKTLLTTGLRKGELASVMLRHLDLDAERAFLPLDAQSEKNREGNSIPLRADLAAEFRDWLADRVATRRQAAQNAPTIKFDRKAGRDGRNSPNEAEGGKLLSPDEPLFDVPAALVKILDRDLEAADIPKRDDRGRTLDVHALRTSFGTHLSMAGVSLRTAQAAMRHSDPKLTANVDTDPRLLDVHGAVEARPILTLTMTRQDAPETLRATGTTGTLDSQLAPTLAPTSGKPCLLMADTGTQAEHFDSQVPQMTDCEKSLKLNENASQEVVSCEAFDVGATGFEPATSWSQSKWQCLESSTNQGNSERVPPACPTACPDGTLSLSLIGSEMTGREVGKARARSATTDAATKAALSVSASTASTPVSGATPAATDFGKALAMIAMLPLTDAEKAEAVRRLLGTG